MVKGFEIDKELEIPSFSTVCNYCDHITGYRECEAFKEIPLEIWNGDNKHTQSYPGDNGIIFKGV